MMEDFRHLHLLEVVPPPSWEEEAVPGGGSPSLCCGLVGSGEPRQQVRGGGATASHSQPPADDYQVCARDCAKHNCLMSFAFSWQPCGGNLQTEELRLRKWRTLPQNSDLGFKHSLNVWSQIPALEFSVASPVCLPSCGALGDWKGYSLEVVQRGSLKLGMVGEGERSKRSQPRVWGQSQGQTQGAGLCSEHSLFGSPGQ